MHLFEMIYRTDYNIHTTFSDGKSAPEDFISPALTADISEIGFSEYLSLFRKEQDWCMNPGNVSKYTLFIKISDNEKHIHSSAF
jgi:histidinol phosphatase-like PHP family hydrolase